MNYFPYYSLLFQDTIRNPSVMDFIDRTLAETPISSKHVLNFLHNGPPEERPADMPDFDWRDIFNLTDRVIRMLNQYGDVSGQRNYLLVKNYWVSENASRRVELT